MDSNSILSSDVVGENDKLYLDEVVVPNDILFPDEFNQYLQGQLQFMQHTNEMLSRNLQENQVELNEKTELVKKLSIKVTEYERFTNPPEGIVVGNPSYLMSAKIIELSKKLKDKTVENQSLKTKFSRMQHKLSTFEHQNVATNLLDIDLEEKENNKDKTTTSILSDEMKCLQDRLSQTTNKLFEIRNKNIELKNELKTANKVLQQELGDSFVSLQNFTSQTSWRGRAQQIINLQQRNTELQEKVMNLSSKDNLLPQPPKTDKRKLIIEQQEKEINNIRMELDDLRKKWNGARARIRVLESECINFKSKINGMSSKTDNDERMISLLKTQISSLDEAANEHKKEKQLALKKIEEENKGLLIEKDRLLLIINNLKKNLHEQSTEITELNNEIEYFKQNCDNAKIPSSFFNKDCNRIKVLELEVNRLLQLVAVLNSRVDEERNAHAYTQINYKKERQKVAKIEVKLSRIELENTLNLNQNHSYIKSFSKLSSRHSEETLSNSSQNLTIEKLKNSLELAEETVAMLKNKLSLLQREKELDFQRFSSILSETSSMLLKMNITGLQIPFTN